MSIFETPTLTHEEELKLHVNGLTENLNGSLQSVINNYEYSLREVWEHPKFTAQEIFNVYGNNAYKLFEESDRVWSFIKQYKPDYVPPVNIRPYNINGDGTVTVLPEPIE